MMSNNNKNDKETRGTEESERQVVTGCCDYSGPRSKLSSCNWLEDVPGDFNDFDIVEVAFKNTRRGFYKNNMHLPLEIGDMVAVEANPGHDIGRVSMVGKLVKLQMKRVNLRADMEILRVFRKAKPNDLARYEEAKAKEVDTMIRSRKIAEDLKLNMKIGDVEYQGDGNKAIFYYIADERVDFRQLIKVLADVFKVRIEMKQIGARQEAGRIGGIGPCGRPLCCSSWMTNFVSVATSAARFQEISLNPQKLAGQCAKLKCCLNFEVDSYVEASKKFPPKDTKLETKDNVYYLFKTDILKREMTFSTEKSVPANLVTLPVARVHEVIKFNKNGIKPDKLELDNKEREMELKEFGDIIEQDSVTRFDKVKKKKNRNKNRQGNSKQQGQGENGNVVVKQPKNGNVSKVPNPEKKDSQENGNATVGGKAFQRKQGRQVVQNSDNRRMPVNNENDGQQENTGKKLPSNRRNNRPPRHRNQQTSDKNQAGNGNEPKGDSNVSNS